MQKSDQRILTTHVGSLPRIPALRDLLKQREEGVPIDNNVLKSETNAAVSRIVEGQLEAGIDIGNNGEQPRVGFSTYVATRMEGFGGESPRPLSLDAEQFPDHASILNEQRRLSSRVNVTHRAETEVRYVDLTEAEEECNQFIEISDKADGDFVERFMTAASPGVLSKFVPDNYYKNEDTYITAMADAMRTEYEAIHKAGLILQIDCPDFGSARHNQYKDISDEEFLKIAWRNMEAVNAATANIPPEAMRLHICWGNYEGPHTHDFPLAKIFPVLMAARPGAILFEGANPRHEHEWEDILGMDIPDHKIFIPGVIDSTSNFVEHPKLVAQRICNWANVVGRERVIAGSDCGFGTFARLEPQVTADIVWSKFRAMAEGAKIATKRLWA